MHEPVRNVGSGQPLAAEGGGEWAARKPSRLGKGEGARQCNRGGRGRVRETARDPGGRRASCECGGGSWAKGGGGGGEGDSGDGALCVLPHPPCSRLRKKKQSLVYVNQIILSIYIFLF